MPLSFVRRRGKGVVSISLCMYIYIYGLPSICHEIQLKKSCVTSADARAHLVDGRETSAIGSRVGTWHRRINASRLALTRIETREKCHPNTQIGRLILLSMGADGDANDQVNVRRQMAATGGRRMRGRRRTAAASERVRRGEGEWSRISAPAPPYYCRPLLRPAPTVGGHESAVRRLSARMVSRCLREERLRRRYPLRPRADRANSKGSSRSSLAITVASSPNGPFPSSPFPSFSPSSWLSLSSPASTPSKMPAPKATTSSPCSFRTMSLPCTTYGRCSHSFHHKTLFATPIVSSAPAMPM